MIVSVYENEKQFKPDYENISFFDFVTYGDDEGFSDIYRRKSSGALYSLNPAGNMKKLNRAELVKLAAERVAGSMEYIGTPSGEIYAEAEALTDEELIHYITFQ